MRPWKPCCMEMILKRPSLPPRPEEMRASLMAASLASAPEWQKKAQAVEGEALEGFGDAKLGFGVKLVAGTPEGAGLGGDGGDEGGVLVAEDGAAEAGEHVDILFAIGIPEEGALAADEDDGLFAVVEDHGGEVAVDELLIGHGAGRSEKKSRALCRGESIRI